MSVIKITKGTSLANNARRYTRKTVAGLLSVVFFAACCPIAFAAEEPDAPLTPDELAGMTHEEIAAISKEQSDATLNKMVQLWQDGEMDTLDEYYAALGFATTYEEYEAQKEEEWLEEQASLEPSIQPLWSSDYWNTKDQSDCHEQITSMGFLIYLSAQTNTFQGNIGYTLDEMLLLSKESGWPDKWDTQLLTYSGHFYDPDTQENYLHSSTPTAKTKFEDYYETAVKAYNSGDREKAIKQLSHGLHFLQDAGEPHHAANKPSTDSDSNHSDFESEAAKLLYDEDLVWDDSVFDFSTSFWNNVNSQSVTSTLHGLAVTAKTLIDGAESPTKSIRELTAKIMLINSMQTTGGIIYKFAHEVKII